MFKEIRHTQFPPTAKPLMVYDGNCGFCMYWIIKWKKITENKVDYKAYQEVHQQFEDIAEQHFKDAVRLITTDGSLYSGPDAAYYTYFNQNKYRFLHLWYNRYAWFKNLSNWIYKWIANNRGLMYKVSVALFGMDPRQNKKYWLFYLLLLIGLIAVMSFYLANSASQ